MLLREVQVTGLSPQWFVRLGLPGHRVEPCIQLVWCCWLQESQVTICRSTSANILTLLVFCTLFFCVHGESLVSCLLLLIFISLVKAGKVCIILTIPFI